MSLILRGTKGAALTHAELDNNQVWLKSRDIVSASVDVNNNLILTKDDFSYYSVPLSGIGTTISGLTFSGNVLTITQSDGSNVSVNISSVDIRVTDLIYSGNTLYLNQSDGSQESVFIPQFTGGTVNGYTIFNNGLSANTFTTNSLTLNGVTITGFTDYVFTGNTSGDCITDLFVSNVNSCSPLHIQNNSFDNVLIGENGGVNVGIGTSSPSEKLEVSGNTKLSSLSNVFKISSYTALGMSQGAGAANVFIGGGTVTDGANGGGISIGASSTTYGDGVSIGQTAKADSTGGDAIAIGRNSTANGSVRSIAIGRNSNSSATNAWALGYNANATQDNTFIFGDSSDINIKSGFGTNTPSARLHIKGSDSSSSNYGLKVQNSGGTDNLVVRNDGNIGIGTSIPNAKLHINNITTGNTVLFEDDTSPDPSPFVIDNGGKVGVGTTTPSEKLEVNNGYIKTNQGVIVDGGTYNGLRFNGSGNSRFAIDNSYKLNAAFTEGFKFTNGVYDFFNYDQSGFGDTFQIGNGLIKGRTTGTTDVYLGINVLGTPSSTLEVNGKTKTTNLQVTSGSPQVGYVLTATDTNGNMTWQAPSSGNTSVGLNQIAFGNPINGNITSSSDFFRNSSNGYVGIGNNSPSSKLHISTSGLTGTSYSVLKIENKGDGTNYLESSIILSSGLFTNPSFDTARLYTTFDGTSIGDGRFTIQTPNESTYIFEDVFTVKNKRVGIGTNFPSERLEVSGKTKTTTLQVTTNPTPGYVLTSDASGNATWQPQNTFTGGTVSGSTNFTGGLTANTLTVGTFQVGRKYSSSESFTGSVIKTITHNLNTQDVIVQLWDSSNNLLNGATITANNVNSVDITVASTTTYKVVIIG